MKRLNFHRQSDQRGLASIVVVLMLIIVISLVSLGMSKLMDRATRQALGNNLSSSADYATLSGVNEVIAWLKGGGNQPSSSCTSLIGSETNPQPFTGLDVLNAGTHTKYTCILIDKHPKDVVYEDIPAYKSKVIALTPSTPMKSMMISWQGHQPTVNSAPAPTDPTKWLDEASWNGNHYQPPIRLTLYKVDPNDLKVKHIPSETYFFYPNTAPASDLITFFDDTATDPGIIKIKCGAQKTDNGDASRPPSGYFDGTADLSCNIVLYNMPTTTGAGGAGQPKVYYYFLRLTPIYTAADFKIKGMDSQQDPLDFGSNQYKIDVTARSGNSIKRLQASVDAPNPVASVTIINPNDDSIPEYGLRTTGTVCKRIKVTNGNNGHVDFTDSDAAGCPPQIFNPPPGYFDLDFYADDNPLAYNSSTSVHWRLNGAQATQCTGSWQAGTITPSYSGAADKTAEGNFTTGSLTANKTYTIDCKNNLYDTGVVYLIVNVSPPPVPVIGLTADSGDNEIDYNGHTHVNWKITNGPATACTGWGGMWGTDKAHGTALNHNLNQLYTQQTNDLTANTTFYMQCENTSAGYNNYQTPIASVTVKVAPQYPLPVLTFSGTPNPFPYNTSVTLSWTISGGPANWCYGYGSTWGPNDGSASHQKNSATGTHTEVVGPFTTNQTYVLECGNNGPNYHQYTNDEGEGYHTPIMTLNLLAKPQPKLTLTVHGFKSGDNVTSGTDFSCITTANGQTKTCSQTYNGPITLVLTPTKVSGSAYDKWNPCPGTLNDTGRKCTITLDNVYSGDYYFKSP